MTYATLAQSPGKQAVQIIELQVERCANAYGVAPCTAVIGTTGAAKCYNTQATCQVPPVFVRSVAKYRFSSVRIDGLQQAGESPTFPTLVSLKTDPTILTPAKGLGVRASVTAVVQDHPYGDQFTDPYLSTRTYDPDLQGSFWGKWLKRNRFYQNRVMVIYTGFLNEDGSFDIANFKTRRYIITQISGPNQQGQVTITAKDPLRLVDDDKRKWPTASQATLAADIDSMVTSITINDPLNELYRPANDPTSPSYVSGHVPIAWGNIGTFALPNGVTPARQQYIRIGDEIMKALSYTVANPGTDLQTVTLAVTRSLMPLAYDSSLDVPAPHSAGDAAQWCWSYDNTKIYDIMYDWLYNVTRLDPSYLPYSTWKTEIEDGFSYMVFTACLAKPAGVKSMMNELTELPILVWWHEREQVIKLKGFRFYSSLGGQLNDQSSIIAESVNVNEDVTSLATESWIYFGLSWPLANMKLLQSYRTIDIEADTDRESDVQYGAPYIKGVATRWIPASGAELAAEFNHTNLLQYRDVRKALQVTVDPKDDNYWVGDIVGVSTKYVQDETGASTARNYLITQAQEIYDTNGLKIQFVMLEQYNFLRVGVQSYPTTGGSGSSPGPYATASTADKATYAFMGYDTNIFPDGQPSYVLT